MPEKRKRNDTQEKIYAYIQSVIKTRGYAPSVREIGEAVGLKSTSTVHGHLTRMEKKGLLYRDAMKPRAMGVVGAAPQECPAADDVCRLPLVGRVAAGAPILAEEHAEALVPVPSEFLGHGEHFVLQVRGDSMINAGILSDDYIVVHRQSDAHNGDVVVALVDDEATVKRYFKENGHFRLQPENDAMEPIIVPEVTILGRVVSLMRRL